MRTLGKVCADAAQQTLQGFAGGQKYDLLLARRHRQASGRNR